MSQNPSDNSIHHWKTARELFENYLDVPVPDALKQVHRDPEISPQVKTILISLIEARSTEDTTLHDADLSFFSTVQKHVEDLSGSSIAEYRLIERIGQGGMSSVYKAERKNSEIQKHVALKLLTSVEEDLSDTLRILFEREQVTLSKLHHPNIISFHHGGISQSGIPFLVMDYIEDAQPIDEFIQKNSFPVRTIVKLVVKVADAMAYAHQNLIIHKDIKPSNILVDALGNPKVVDFGIASFMQKDSGFNASQTGLSARIFTPDYASPEQVKGETITASSDIFSLGALLLKLITKEKPLPALGNETVDDIDLRFTNHIENVIAKSDMDRDLASIIKLAMQFNAQDRYPSMSSFKNDLNAYLQKMPVSSRKQSAGYLIKKYIVRNPALSFTYLALILSVSIGFYTTVQQKNEAQLQALKARQVTDFLLDSIQQTDPDISKGRDISVRELLQNARFKIGQKAIKDIQLTASLQQTIGSALAKIGQYNEAEELLLDAIRSDPDSTDARLNLTKLYLSQQYFDKCEEQISYLNSVVQKMTEFQSIRLSQLKAELLYQKGDFTSAVNILERILLNPDTDTRQWIQSHLLLADIYDEDGQYEKAIDILETALHRSIKEYSKISTISTNILIKMSDVYANMSPVPEEKLHDIYQDALKIQVKIYGSNHPLVAKTYLKYGFLLKTLGKNLQARDYANKSRSIALNQFGENHMLTAHTDLLISQLDYIDGDIASAIELLNNALDIYESHYGDTHFETNQIKTTLAGYYLRSGKGQLALDMLNPVYQFQKQQYGETNKATIYAKLMILKAYNMDADFSKAVKEGERLLQLARSNLGEQHIVTVGVKFSLAESYLFNNQKAKSKQICEDLLKIDLVKNNSRYFQKVNELLLQVES